ESAEQDIRRRAPGVGGLRDSAPAGSRRPREHPNARPRGGGPDGRATGRSLFRGGAARVRLSRRRQGGRHTREQDIPGGVPAGQPPHRDERSRSGLPLRDKEADVPGKLVHLSQVRPPADEGRAPALGRARAHQRALRHSEDSWDQALPGLQPSVRDRLREPYAHQPL
ncbi:MAG: GDP-L-fucose synthetase, partial [uncultured Rubrobacteraceae bacterium]